MAREIKKLSARTVATLTTPGRHSDGEGLYLVVDKSGARRWLFMFRWDGKRQEMGLGGVNTVSLAEARDKAAEARKQVHDGVNPITARTSAKTARRERQTFGPFADELIEGKKDRWRSRITLWLWTKKFREQTASIRDLPLDEITTEHVLAILKPMWVTRVSAMQVRGRIEDVLDAAKALGHRSGENPARWRGHLANLLPKAPKGTKIKHFPAMHHELVPAFIAQLRERNTVISLALEFTILCASRTNEVLGATWGEMDLENRIWTIPGPRMKAGLEHRVPLTDRAVEIIDTVRKVAFPGLTGPNDFVFPGSRRGMPIHPVGLLQMVKKRLQLKDITVHGFRSTFRDWCGECTSFPRELAELSLSHAVGDLTERSYRRRDALDRRRKLMEAWASFCGSSSEGAPSNVLPLKVAKGHRRSLLSVA